jgi:CheY-like chemotaxis protein
MPKPGTPRTILVVEDELLYLELVVIRCEQIGFEVISARTVDEALSLLEQLQTVDLTPKTVDAIWLDHFLPEKNGNEFVSEILKHDVYKNIPIFLVTNAVESEIINWYLRAGIKQHFPKITAKPEQIVAAIDLYLQQHPSGDRLPDTIHRS